MNKSGYPSVTITFDGMMLFHFDEKGNNCHCKVMFRSGDTRGGKIHGHKIEVIAKKMREDGSSEDWPVPELTHDRLSSYDMLWLYVETPGEPRDFRGDGNAVCGKLYDNILMLDGKEFYEAPSNSSLKLKDGMYKPTMYVCDGCVGADNAREKDKGDKEKLGFSRSEGDESICCRVTLAVRKAEGNKPAYSFKELKYALSPQNWQRLKNSYKNDLIKGLYPFIKWVDTTIGLNNGQKLMLMGENKDGATYPFKPLIADYRESDVYWIHIKYTDSVTPISLDDCHGLGHHCEAFERNGQPLDPLYSVFSPKNGLVDIPTAPWEPQIKSSDVPCCLSACVKQYV